MRISTSGTRDGKSSAVIPVEGDDAVAKELAIIAIMELPVVLSEKDEVGKAEGEGREYKT